MIVFSKYIQNHNSIYQNFGDIYFSMVNATTESGIDYHTHFTVSKYGQIDHIFFFF